MKSGKMVTKTIVKGLKAVIKEVERMEKLLDKLEKAQPARKPRAAKKAAPKKRVAAKRKAAPKKKVAKKAPARRGAKVTAIDKVAGIIGKSKKGVTTAQIKQKTGFPEKKIWDIVNRLKRQGKVKSAKKGIYQKA